MKLHITVTQKNIDEGVRENGQGCPIALALHDLGYPYVEVTPDGIRWDADCEEMTANSVLPDAASWFISRFDNNDPVEPFEFDVEMNDEPEEEDE